MIEYRRKRGVIIILVISQDRDVYQVNKIYWKKQYFKKHWWSKKMLVGHNVMGEDLDGGTVLLGTYDNKTEAEKELKMLNHTKDSIYHFTEY